MYISQTPQPLEDEGSTLFRNVGNIDPSTHYHITEDQKLRIDIRRFSNQQWQKCVRWFCNSRQSVRVQYIGRRLKNLHEMRR
jgi:hypothetical protein